MRDFESNALAQAVAHAIAPVGVHYLGRFSGIEENTRRVAHQAAALAVLETLRYVIDEIDSTPAVLWIGKGGVKERILAMLQAND